MKRLSFRTLFGLCLCAFLLCILVTVAPLSRLAGTTLLSSLPTNIVLTVFGTKLPTDLHLTTDIHASQINTDAIEFLALMSIIFLLYALAAWLASKWLTVHEAALQTEKMASPRAEKTALKFIWLTAIIAGIVYVLTPSLLSRDAAVYAGYGRVLITYSANPYYTPLSAFPHDALFQFDDWHNALAAYGPVWLLVCGLSTLVAGSSILHYIFFYRILGLCAYLLTIALVTAILRTLKCSPRMVVLGTLLYALNPLVLLESCLGGHNDTLMMLCVIGGVLLSLKAERNNFSYVKYYLPPAIAFTMATLIKFTVAPMLVLYIVLLIVRTLQNASSFPRRQAWLSSLYKGGNVTLVSVVLIVVLYIPLWLGHTLSEIATSIGSPPSARLAFGSILLALQKVATASHTISGLLALFSLHSTWNGINALVVGILFGLGIWWLWREPTTLTMIRATLALLGGLLIVTPWFFPWYVLWLISLAVLALPAWRERITAALIGSALTFSWSALFIYLFRGYAPLGGWVGFTCLTTIGPPLGVFLLKVGTDLSRPRWGRVGERMGNDSSC